MADIRSRKCVFISHCILAQGVMADGLVKHFPGPIRPVIEFCLEIYPADLDRIAKLFQGFRRLEHRVLEWSPGRGELFAEVETHS